MAKTEIIKRPVNLKEPVEQAGNEIKKTAWLSIAESLSLIVLGILFTVWPDQMKTIVAYVIGTFFVVKGGFQIVNYFIEKGQNNFFNNNLLFGVISVLVGISVFLIGDNIANVFRVIVGVLIVYEALSKINTAIKLHAAGVQIWKYILILAMIVLVLGIFVTFNDVATVIGWIMIIAGLFEIVSDVIFMQQVNTVVDIITKKIEKL